MIRLHGHSWSEVIEYNENLAHSLFSSISTKKAAHFPLLS